MISIKRLFLLSLLLMAAMTLPGQESALPEEELDIDSLFEETPVTEELPAAKPVEEIDLLKDIVKNEGFSLGASFNLNMGYSPGWMVLPGEFKDTAFLDSSSALSLDMQISPVFRVLQKYTISYPDFEPEVIEFFADYTLADRLFFRAGRQNITWGISRNFPFTNLPARIPDDFPAEETGNYALKMSVPVGIGGFEALLFTRDGYFADPALPKFEEFGFGGKFNLALSGLDISLAGFFHQDMHFRSVFYGSTTIFDKYEIYSEALVSFDPNAPDTEVLTDEGKVDNPFDKSISAGFYFDHFNGNLEVNGEYLFNGEESELEVYGAKFPLFFGHNMAFNMSFKTFKKKVKFFTQLKLNLSDSSGFLLPGVSLYPMDNLELGVAMPMFFGSESSTYVNNNFDILDRKFSIVLGVKLSGNLKEKR